MRNLSLVLLVTAAGALAWAGCDRSRGAEPEKTVNIQATGNTAIGEVAVGELATWLAGNECTVLDANKESVRLRHGTVPGAVLLSDYQDYGLDELPASRERKLVFYCANQYCRASDAAAEKARLAGYKDVNVLRAGIMGWIKAGQKTEPAK